MRKEKALDRLALLVDDLQFAVGARSSDGVAEAAGLLDGVEGGLVHTAAVGEGLGIYAEVAVDAGFDDGIVALHRR